MAGWGSSGLSRHVIDGAGANLHPPDAKRSEMLRTMRQLFFVAIVSALIVSAQTGSAAADPPSTSIPTAHANDLKKLWKSVMLEFYGAYDRNEKCWIGTLRKDGETERHCMRPHKLEVRSEAAGKMHYFVIAGHRTDSWNCHACGGSLGFVVLLRGDQHFQLLARNSLFEEFGSWGVVPPEDRFHLEPLGPDGAHGWLVETGYTAQGYFTSRLTIFAITESSMPRVGSIPLGFSDGGACVDGSNVHSGEGCSDYDGRYQIENTGGTYASIQLTLSGTRKGNEFNSSFVIEFDDGKSQYAVPDELRLY